MTTNEQPTPRKLTGDHCRCTGCGEYFNSTAAFDKHRDRKGAVARCLTTDEMEAKGMARSSTNWWCGSLRVNAGATISTDPLPGYGA